MTLEEALRELDRLALLTPTDVQQALLQVSAVVRAEMAARATEAASVGEAQASALVHSAMLMSELEEARDELQRVASEAEAASRAKSAFVANMSHELRTPLNAIIGYSELIVEQAKDEGLSWVEQDASRVRGAGRHLLALINDVLDISKIEAGRVELERSDFRVNELTEGFARDFGMVADAKGIRFVLSQCATGSMSSDRTRVRQVIDNVLSNACKFTHHGTVSLHVQGDAEQVVFTVQDTGIGMSAEQLSNLFERFQQADSSTTRLYGGSGLGLHLSRQLVGLLGGGIEVQSVLGQGTTVVVTLPRVLAS